jgi:hypothetical protein
MSDLEAELTTFMHGGPLVAASPVADGEPSGVHSAESSAVPSRGLIASASRQSRGARPWIVFSMLLIIVWGYGLTVGALARMVSLVTALDLARSELLMITIGTAIAMLTPIVLWARLIGRTAWRNSVLALGVARRLRAFAAASLATLGLGALAFTIVARFIPPDRWALFGQLGIAVASVLAGLIAHMMATRRE